MREAGQRFSRGKNNRLPWPARAFMVSDRHKVLYAPIGKCACTSLKTMMVRLARVEGFEDIIRLGVHEVTDRFNTGMHLKDLPLEEAIAIVESPYYYKFAVVRDPVERLISAYIEKFVVRRFSQDNQSHTAPVISAVQGAPEADIDRGISFRQFIEHLVQQPAASLDPHWAPQFLCLAGLPHSTRLYPVDDLATLQADLQAWTGEAVQIGELNKTTDAADPQPEMAPADYAIVDCLPAELQAMGSLPPLAFHEPGLLHNIESYYQEDRELYRASAESHRFVSLPALDFQKIAQQIAATRGPSDQDIWGSVHLYSKGLLGIRESGHGSTAVTVVNGSNIDIDSGRFANLRIEYQFFDRQNAPITDQDGVKFITGTVRARGHLQINLEIALPADSVAMANKVQINLRADSAEAPLQHSLAHTANAEVVLVND